MGIGFTIVIWGIIFSVLAVVLGILAALGVRICCKPKGRGQKMVLAFLTPGLAIFVYAVCSVLYMAMISIVFHVDLGIGDSWYGHEAAWNGKTAATNRTVCRTD